MRSMTYEDDRVSAMSAIELGTLMWIGARDREFAEPYQFCLANSAQVALRDNCQQALDRRAAGVRGIVVARNNRGGVSAQALTQLQHRYAAAQVVHLMGALSLGMRSGAELPALQRLPWYRWNEVLTDWLTNWGSAELPPSPTCRSVAVVAANFEAAEPLLGLADSAGATTAWVAAGDCLRARNFDAVWWDDSVATPTTLEPWRDRIRAFGNATTHVWIAGNIQRTEQDFARRAGIDHIFVKPYSIDGLLQTLAQPAVASLRCAA
jgi:hypothetical protein